MAVGVLKVSFSPALQPITRPKLNSHALTRNNNPQFSIAQPDNISKPPAPATEVPATPTQGIALPGAITMPWQLPGRSSNSSFHPPSPQQNTERNYYQQGKEAQARQRNEYQMRLIMQQLQQLLTRVLDVKPAVEGKIGRAHV